MIHCIWTFELFPLQFCCVQYTKSGVHLIFVYLTVSYLGTDSPSLVLTTQKVTSRVWQLVESHNSLGWKRTFISHLLPPKFRLDVIVGNLLRTIQLSLSPDRINPFLLMANSGERRNSDMLFKDAIGIWKTGINAALSSNKIVRCQTYYGVCEFVRSLITPIVGSLYFCFCLCFPWSRLPDPLTVLWE